MEALCERLTLLFQLGVPCILQFRVASARHVWRTRMQGWERRDGRLVLSADRISLHLQELHIEPRWVIQWSRDGRARRILELRDKSGPLRASILGPRTQEGSAVWQDVLDTFIWPLTGAET